MIDYDIIPTNDLYELLLENEEYLAKLKETFQILSKSITPLKTAAINRKNGKEQTGLDSWDKSKIQNNWREIINH